jgi:DNA-binding transcriptional LysR family regulator
MSRKIDWERQIGRRLKLRDLHVLLTVIQRGSMGKAATRLNVSQSAVSEVIANLEHTLGVRLLDRSSQGVEPTMYGDALLKRAIAAFDELKQGISDIEFLADPTAGELRIGCAESVAAAIVTPVGRKLYQQYPRVILHVEQLTTPTLELPRLRERSLDIVLARLVKPIANEDNDLNVDTLFNDQSVVVAGSHSRWSRRRQIDLAELVNEPWVLPPPDSWNSTIIAEAFRARGLDAPKICSITYSVHLRASLSATGPFLTALPISMLRSNASRYSVKILPVDLPPRPWPVAIVSLKNRTLSPVAQLFVDHVRAFAKSMDAGSTLGPSLSAIPGRDALATKRSHTDQSTIAPGH